MDKEYEAIFKRLMHERNELRKYIIDICKSLDINTSQSVLGANCLEFYAVLYSTAKNKISYMEGYIRTVENARDEFAQELKRKEEECEKLNSDNRHFVNQIISLELLTDKQEQSLTEIKEIAEENIRIADLEGLNGVYRRGLAEQILQKISEVLKDE